MFENLSDKLESAFKKLRGHGKLDEKNIDEGLKEVRMALLEADVHYRVVKSFIEGVRSRALGQEVMASLTPGQQVVKIVNEQLTELMGSRHEELTLAGVAPASVMLVGLQGSGKTTTAGKLAVLLRKKGRRPFLVPADVYRPAAIDQLKTIGEQVGVPVFASATDQDPVQICLDAKAAAFQNGCDTLVLDTAGRLHIDEELMAELGRIKDAMRPSDILLVADAMTGQDAVNIAASFNERLDIGGVILTKMDGDARGGAALSIKSITGKPIKFVGVGEKLSALEPFHPDRMAASHAAVPRDVAEAARIARPETAVSRETLRAQWGVELADAVIGQLEIVAKYAGYIDKQVEEVERAASLEGLPLPSEFDYSKVAALSFEVRQKLTQQRPATLGQAARICFT